MDAQSTSPPADHVTRLQYGDKELYIVGTAHISRQSVEEVERVIREVRPDTVCVELDATRHDAMIDDSRWRKLDVFQVIKEKKVLFFMSSLLLTAYQRKLGDKLGVRPGAEMLAAVLAAHEVDAELVLADRDIQATLKRSFHNLSFWNKAKLIGVMIAAFFATSEITEEQIESLKDRDTIGEMMRAFAVEMPELQIPLIDERDRYLMSSVQEAPGRRIVAVVGMGHVEGMTRYLGQDVDRDALAEIPEPRGPMRVLKWVIPTIVLVAFYFGYREHRGQGLAQMLYAWILPNSVAAALLSIVAGAKPLSVVTAFVASPITSLNPTIGAGMVTGLVEAWLRRPTVADAEGVNEDMMTLAGMYRNPFTRVLLVTIAATVGSAVGAWIGATWVVTLL
jgi:pheromone shutdown-related protein TraB